MTISQSAEALKQFITRIETLLGEKHEIAEHIKEAYAEAKAHGFDPKIMREVIKMRAKEVSELENEAFLLETYKKALGM